MRSHLVSIFGIGLGLAACASNSDDPTDPGGGDPGGGSGSGGGSEQDAQLDYDDVARSIGANAQSGQLAAMLDVVTIAFAGIPVGLTEVGAGHVQGTRGGMSFDYLYYCRAVVDVDDVPCDGLENHVHIKTKFSGSITAANMSMDNITRTSSWTVRDVAVQKPRVDGPGHFAFTSHLATGTYALAVDDMFTRVRFTPAPTLPSAGTIDLAITAHRTREGAVPAERDYAVAAQISFLATDGAATLMLDGSVMYDFNLATGDVVRAN